MTCCSGSDYPNVSIDAITLSISILINPSANQTSACPDVVDQVRTDAACVVVEIISPLVDDHVIENPDSFEGYQNIKISLCV